MTLLSLHAGSLALDLAPEAGGTIARLAWSGSDLLRRGVGTTGACYPLVPYSNRIANGRFSFEGETIVLPVNWPGHRHPMHGDGWAAAWQVERADGTTAELAYEHDGRAGWPFRYRARQTFRLGESSLSVTMSLANLEPRAAPGGLGLHPFFVRDPDSTLACRAAGVWLADAEVLPTERVPLPASWNFAAARRVEEVALDHCFDGWDGEATIAWPARGLALRMTATPPFRHLVVYTPPGRPFFCVEPVSHANGAIGRTRLEAGATLTGEIVFAIRKT